MANYMFVLRPVEKKITVVCPACTKRGEVISTCPACRGTAVKKKSIQQYYVQDKPIPIDRIDRDPKTGILRYWENKSDFYYETLYPSIHSQIQEVPYGVHLCHDTKLFAQTECERINNYLSNLSKENLSKVNFSF